jgi:hypothetical protein
MSSDKGSIRRLCSVFFVLLARIWTCVSRILVVDGDERTSPFWVEHVQ